MLEQMRKQGASIFVYLIFCLLIAIFVINFRPGQSRNDDGGCSGTSNSALNVDGDDVSKNDFKVAFVNPYNWGQDQKGKIHVALETVLRRELLAKEADTRGLIINEDLVMEQIKKGRFYQAVPVPPGQTDDVEAIYRPIRKMIPGIFSQEDGHWQIEVFKNFIGRPNISQNAFIQEQRRSMLAAMMADVLMEGIQVSREEAQTQYQYENDTATYDVVQWKPETFRAALRMTDADVDRFLKDHDAEVQARYKADERTYKGTKPALKLREIFIAKAADAPAPGSGSGSGAGSGSADKAPVAAKGTLPIDAAKAKLEAVRAGGKDKFAAAARELNTDDGAKAVAGDIGWHSVENAALGDKALNDAVKTLKPGELTPVITTDKGAYLFLADDKREGDLTFDQVKRELGWEMAKDFYAKEAAKRAAIAGLAASQGKKLDEIFEKDSPAPGGIDLEQMLNDPNTPEQQKQMIRQILEKQKAQHGALEVVEKDIPAGWFESQEGTGSAVGSAAPAGSAAPTGSAAQSGGSAAGSAAAGAPAPSPTPAPTPKADADVVATKDVLPAMADVGKAHVTRVGPVARRTQMAGLGTSKDAIDSVYEGLKPGELGKSVVEAGGSYVIFQLVDRKQPNMAEFDKDADRRVAELRAQRANAFLDGWLRTRCEKLAKENKIKPAADLIVEHDDQGKALPTSYKPCMFLR